MKLITMCVLCILFISCHSLVYDLAQEAENERCRDRVVDGDNLACELDDESFEDYSKKREHLLDQSAK